MSRTRTATSVGDDAFARTFGATVTVWLFSASVLLAQPFAGAAGLVSWQPDNSPYVGTQNPSVPAQGIHGTAAGVWATVGAFATPVLGFAGEISLPERLTADQVADKYRTHNLHRDVIVSGVLHVRPGPRWLDGVVGLSYVREQTDQQLALRIFSSTAVEYAPFPAVATAIERTTFGIVAGVDVPVALGRHVSLTPQVRVHRIAREDDSTAASPRFLGLSSMVLRPAVGLRVIF